MKFFTLLLLGCIGLLSPLAFAVGTSNWAQTSEADWKAGTFDNVVATNLGDLKLSRAVKTVLEQDEQVSSVNALAEGPDGTIYAGTGPRGVLLRIRGDEVSKLLTIDDATAVLSLRVDREGRLLIGTGGDSGRILRLDHPEKEGEKPVEVFKAEGVQYVWQIRQTPDGNLYAATGPTGKLFEIKPDGSQRALLETGENNVTALTSDDKDLLYAGTDPNGLVYRVNRRTGDAFVLFDASEAEISALVLDAKGNLYASTAEAKEEAAAPAGDAAAEAGGRPEGGSAGVPITAQPPKEPAPPKLPDPNPGRPAPIPKVPREPGRGKGGESKEGDARSSAGERTREATMRPVMATVGRTRFRVPGRGVPGRVGSKFPGGTNRGLPAAAMTGSEGAERGAGFSRFMTRIPSPEMLLDGALLADPPVPGPRPPKPPHLPAPPGTKPTSQPAAPAATTPGRQPAVEPQPAEPRPEGNAVYRIDPEGFVTEVFRGPVLVLAMVEDHGSLLIATGNEGQIYQVNPAAGETVVLAKVEPRDVMALLPARDGRVWLGLADVGGVAAMSPGFAAKGTYTSQVLDATQISRFGKMHLTGSLVEGSAIAVSTRSGNVRDPAGKGWSEWTEEAPATEFLQVKSPSARFFQYRLTLSSKDGRETPVVADVNVAYQMPNLPPAVKSVKLTPAADPAAAAAGAAEGQPQASRIPSTRRQVITWEASDPNNDPLQYALYFRLGGQGGGSPWILLKDKLTDPTFEWDTRSVADGRYEVRVVASDAAANVPGKGLTAGRVSDPVLVDNTPPVIGDIRTSQHGADVKVSFRVTDQTGVVSAGEYSVDSSRDWQTILPSDNIWDGPEETAEFTLPGLPAGRHQVTIRATDSSGNQAFENVFVTVQGPAAAR